MSFVDPDIQAECERLTQIEISRMQRAEAQRTKTNSGVNQRCQEQVNANQH
jgi:hypothetical protein